MGADPIVRLERPREGVALVTVANPAIRNHGSWATVEQLAARLAEAREGGARVVVIASGVPGHWIEHAWLPDLMNMLRGRPTTGDGAAWFRVLRELSATPVVSIAAISGDCSGGGAEIGWACDLRIAEEQACFGQPEVRIGVATGVGGTCRVARLLGRTATAELVLDGAPLRGRCYRKVRHGRATSEVDRRRRISTSEKRLAVNSPDPLHPPAVLACIPENGAIPSGRSGSPRLGAGEGRERNEQGSPRGAR